MVYELDSAYFPMRAREILSLGTVSVQQVPNPTTNAFCCICHWRFARVTAATVFCVDDCLRPAVSLAMKKNMTLALSSSVTRETTCSTTMEARVVLVVTT